MGNLHRTRRTGRPSHLGDDEKRGSCHHRQTNVSGEIGDVQHEAVVGPEIDRNEVNDTGR